MARPTHVYTIDYVASLISTLWPSGLAAFVELMLAYVPGISS